ncbi:hypothetical protein, partial [Cecembia lonarensis]|uniref:hypothetical protein n=1 Tax=Cecembia lonarensis TaxID=645110 RepID=UPI0012F919B9
LRSWRKKIIEFSLAPIAVKKIKNHNLSRMWDSQSRTHNNASLLKKTAMCAKVSLRKKDRKGSQEWLQSPPLRLFPLRSWRLK